MNRTGVSRPRGAEAPRYFSKAPSGGYGIQPQRGFVEVAWPFQGQAGSRTLPRLFYLLVFCYLLVSCKASPSEAVATPTPSIALNILGTWSDTNRRTEVQVWTFYEDGRVEVHLEGWNDNKPEVSGIYEFNGEILRLQLLHPRETAPTLYEVVPSIKDNLLTLSAGEDDFVTGTYERVD